MSNVAGLNPYINKPFRLVFPPGEVIVNAPRLVRAVKVNVLVAVADTTQSFPSSSALPVPSNLTTEPTANGGTKAKLIVTIEGAAEVVATRVTGTFCHLSISGASSKIILLAEFTYLITSLPTFPEVKTVTLCVPDPPETLIAFAAEIESANVGCKLKVLAAI